MQIQDESELPLAREIRGQTDRGAAIVAVAYLESKLDLALEARLNNQPHKEAPYSRLFSKRGALGALVPKMELGLLLNMYGEQMLDDMLLLAKIRNRFAHLSEVIDFGSQAIRERCNNLKLAELTFGMIPGYPLLQRPLTREDARTEFMRSISIASNLLAHVARCPDKSAPF